ncbi:MAG: hypothetical protein QM756_20650 [Polyangiaceae bacterium]
MNKQRHPVLGIDVGRVIICAADPSGRNDTSFLSGSDEQALQTPPSQGAFSAIAALCQEFDGRVWLVSKCGPRIQQLTRRWLSESGFHRATGVSANQVRFCRKRPEKRDHCLQIGATHFVDDRLDVLSHLAGLVPNLYWFGHQAGDPLAPPYAQRTLDWPATHEAIVSSLGWFHVRSAQGRAR